MAVMSISSEAPKRTWWECDPGSAGAWPIAAADMFCRAPGGRPETAVIALTGGLHVAASAAAIGDAVSSLLRSPEDELHL